MNIKENKLIQYIIEARKELKKVVWPTKKQTKDHSLLVVAVSLSVAAFLGLLDYIFNIGIEQIIK